MYKPGAVPIRQLVGGNTGSRLWYFLLCTGISGSDPFAQESRGQRLKEDAEGDTASKMGRLTPEPKQPITKQQRMPAVIPRGWSGESSELGEDSLFRCVSQICTEHLLGPKQR